jgi:hypothetical protein
MYSAPRIQEIHGARGATISPRQRPPFVAAPWHTVVLILGFGYFSFRLALTNGNTQAALTGTAPSRSAQLLH